MFGLQHRSLPQWSEPMSLCRRLVCYGMSSSVVDAFCVVVVISQQGELAGSTKVHWMDSWGTNPCCMEPTDKPNMSWNSFVLQITPCESTSFPCALNQGRSFIVAYENPPHPNFYNSIEVAIVFMYILLMKLYNGHLNIP